MYIRFITQFTNPYGEADTGIFLSLQFLRDDNLSTQDDDVTKLKDLTAWFNQHLNKPTRFSNATNKSPSAISLSWFKDTAKEHIKRIYELINILEKYQIIVETVTTKNPGYIVFEDDHQVSAIPFKAQRNKVK